MDLVDQSRLRRGQVGGPAGDRALEDRGGVRERLRGRQEVAAEETSSGSAAAPAAEGAR